LIFLHGVQQALKLNISFLLKERGTIEEFSTEGWDKSIQLIDVDHSTLVLPLVAMDRSFPDVICGTNVTCVASSSSEVTCKRCCLRYHEECVGGDSDTCGCEFVSMHKQKLFVLKSRKCVLACLKVCKQKAALHLTDILSLKVRSSRMDSMEKPLERKKSNEQRLEQLNYCYNLLVPEDCKNVMKMFLNAFIRGESITSIFVKVFDLRQVDDVVENVLFPELCKVILRQRLGEINDLTLERIFQDGV